MSAERIPLFPLGIVLFPGQAAPLHIFESRYRDMARDCIESQSSFGIVLVHQETIARIGCSAMIVKTLREYDDGRSDILIAGQQAFRMIRTYEEKSYFEADVEYLEEDFQGIDSGVSAQLVQLFNQCHRNLYEEDGPPFETEGSISLAYHIASELPVDVTFRQRLLEQRSESERQRLLVAHLAEWYLHLQTRDRVRGKTSGNGHGKL